MEGISSLPGIGPSRAKLLNDMGIQTIDDLLSYFPRDYDDRSQIKTVSMLVPDAAHTTHSIQAEIKREPENIVFNRPNTLLNMTKLILQDETGMIDLIWFGQPYLKKTFKKGETYVFTGRVSEKYGRLQMESPEYEKITQKSGSPAEPVKPVKSVKSEALSAGRIVPIYTLPKGISQKMFRKWMKVALELSSELSSELPSKKLPEHILNIHFPISNEHFYAARRQLVFEELFSLQLALLQIKGKPQPGIKINTEINSEISTKINPEIISKTNNADFTILASFLDRLPFELTKSQEKVLSEILSDLQKGHCMNRLIQGDVGTGKTVVAAAAAYLVINSGYQAAVMAPTEVLASQHYERFKEFFGDNYNLVLLTGSLKAGKKKEVYAAIQKGQAQLIIGTHALIQENVKFYNLALVITDEQHRFGVNQRAALTEKGSLCENEAFHKNEESNKNKLPHTLMMTATPIPRTLALILYGDMDISTIDTLPPGRKAIKTYCVNSSYHIRLQNFMVKEAEAGRQVFVICPAINESSDYNSVIAYTDKLQKTLPDHIKIACLHGQLKDKEAIMSAFGRNEYSILVSTTVIEVGVDVPNASLVVIENAERFGLSQLHQLRGRVGRGIHASYCVLVTDSKAGHTIERMRAMESTNDGFILSELDLKQRGPGDFFGVRQHGLPDFKIANLYRDMDILKEAQKAAIKFLEMAGSATYEPYEVSHQRANNAHLN